MLRSFAFLFLLPMSAQALELAMPLGLVQSSESEQRLATLTLPTGVWDGSEVPSISLTGQITTATFHAPESRKPDVVAAAILSFSNIFAIDIGSVAPSISLLDQNGKKWHSSDFLNEKNILIFFYPAAMTGG